MKQVSNLYSCWSFNFTKLAWVVHLGIYLKLNMTFIAAAIPSTPILGILHMRHRCNKIEWFIYLCGGAYLWVAFGFKDLINRPRCRILICRSVAPGLIKNIQMNDLGGRIFSDHEYQMLEEFKFLEQVSSNGRI